MDRPLIALVIISLLAPLAAAGKVRVVATTGAPFVRVQDAINAAQRGDVILVKSAAQDSMRITQKCLAIVGDTGVNIQQAGAVRVTRTAPGALVVLSGITSLGTLDANVSDLSHGFYADDNQGQILAQDCSFTGLSGSQPCIFASDGAYVRNSAGVAFTRCTATGGSLLIVRAINLNASGVQGHGLEAVNSTIACDGVTLRGGHDGSSCMSFYTDGGFGGYGATLSASTLFSAGSSFGGGDGGDALGIGTTGCQPGAFGGWGGHGLNASSTTVRILATTAFGGNGGLGCGLGLTGAHGVPINGAATTISGTQRTLNGSRLVRDTSPATLTFNGAPGETVEIAVSLAEAVQQLDLTQKGVLHVPNPRWRPVGVVPASGTLSKSYKLPNLPLTDPGAIFIVQARFTNTTSGQMQLSNPHALIEVDATY